MISSESEYKEMNMGSEFDYDSISEESQNIIIPRGSTFHIFGLGSGSFTQLSTNLRNIRTDHQNRYLYFFFFWWYSKLFLIPFLHFLSKWKQKKFSCKVKNKVFRCLKHLLQENKVCIVSGTLCMRAINVCLISNIR